MNFMNCIPPIESCRKEASGPPKESYSQVSGNPGGTVAGWLSGESRTRVPKVKAEDSVNLSGKRTVYKNHLFADALPGVSWRFFAVTSSPGFSRGLFWRMLYK